LKCKPVLVVLVEHHLMYNKNSGNTMKNVCWALLRWYILIAKLNNCRKYRMILR